MKKTRYPRHQPGAGGPLFRLLSAGSAGGGVHAGLRRDSGGDRCAEGERRRAGAAAKEIQAQLNAIAADKDEALEQKSLLEQQINVIQSEINNIDAQIAKYDELISQKEDELAQLEQQEAEQYQLFCERVRYMEEEGRSPIGPSSLTRRISLTCWTAS